MYWLYSASLTMSILSVLRPSHSQNWGQITVTVQEVEAPSDDTHRCIWPIRARPDPPLNNLRGTNSTCGEKMLCHGPLYPALHCDKSFFPPKNLQHTQWQGGSGNKNSAGPPSLLFSIHSTGMCLLIYPQRGCMFRQGILGSGCACIWWRRCRFVCLMCSGGGGGGLILSRHTKGLLIFYTNQHCCTMHSSGNTYIQLAHGLFTAQQLPG